MGPCHNNVARRENTFNSGANINFTFTQNNSFAQEDPFTQQDPFEDLFTPNPLDRDTRIDQLSKQVFNLDGDVHNLKQIITDQRIINTTLTEENRSLHVKYQLLESQFRENAGNVLTVVQSILLRLEAQDKMISQQASRLDMQQTRIKLLKEENQELSEKMDEMQNDLNSSNEVNDLLSEAQLYDSDSDSVSELPVAPSAKANKRSVSLLEPRNASDSEEADEPDNQPKAKRRYNPSAAVIHTEK